MPKRQPKKAAPSTGAVYSLETAQDVQSDYLQVKSEGSFVIRVDGDFRGPYSPDVRKMVIRFHPKDRHFVIMSTAPVELDTWSSAHKVDPIPKEIPLQREPTLTELVRSMIRNEISAQAQAEGKMTFEEFDNLGGTDDEFDEEDFPLSPYELSDMQEDAEYIPPETPSEPPQAPEKVGSSDEPETPPVPPDGASQRTAGEAG